MMSPEVAGRRLVHVGSSVQFDAAYIFVAYPDVNVGRFETVLPSVYDEAELTLNGDGRHLSPWTRRCCRYALSVSHDDTRREGVDC